MVCDERDFYKKSIGGGGSHGSLRPELAILEKIFSLPKIIFFLISLFSRRFAGSFMYFILQHSRKLGDKTTEFVRTNPR